MRSHGAYASSLLNGRCLFLILCATQLKSCVAPHFLCRRVSFFVHQWEIFVEQTLLCAWRQIFPCYWSVEVCGTLQILCGTIMKHKMLPRLGGQQNAFTCKHAFLTVAAAGVTERQCAGLEMKENSGDQNKQESRWRFAPQGFKSLPRRSILLSCVCFECYVS
jgi:hypothetical protein